MPSIDQKSFRKRKQSQAACPDDTEATTPKKRITESHIQTLEHQVSESRKYYNNITELQNIAESSQADSSIQEAALISLCRVFSRLIVEGSLDAKHATTEAENTVQRWLLERYLNYFDLLVANIISTSKASESQVISLTLAMRLVKHEVERQGESAWRSGIFCRIVQTWMSPQFPDILGKAFASTYFRKYSDVRFYTLLALPKLITETSHSKPNPNSIDHVINLLAEVPGPVEKRSALGKVFIKGGNEMHNFTLSQYKRAVQDAWLAILGCNLGKKQRKRILSMIMHHIVPWFRKVERLMDFLTDSYNAGGETSLLALAGLFHLISEKNLDYPQFYSKLYSLLDDGLLYSKQRSRFFRLLDVFMASTHLPAALVASFIKRLSRLALFGPPAGIVAVVPWVYNMFKRHPTCTFMVHRQARTEKEGEEWELAGFADPFDMKEEDPMATRAIESSLWELVALQSHYHPNVATLAKVISDQFTKQSYNLEDFLDYSYNMLIDVELEKDLKKDPIIEYEIPKTILCGVAGGTSELGELFEQL